MKTAVVGSGAWGTALAISLHKNGHEVTIWSFEKELIPQIEKTRENPRLPGALLPEGIHLSPEYACVKDCKLVVIASPSFPIRSVCRGIAPYLREDAVLVCVTKGLDPRTAVLHLSVLRHSVARSSSRRSSFPRISPRLVPAHSRAAMR